MTRRKESKVSLAACPVSRRGACSERSVFERVGTKRAPRGTACGVASCGSAAVPVPAERHCERFGVFSVCVSVNSALRL